MSSHPIKRRRLSSESQDGSDDEARQAMLKLLESHCAQNLDVAPIVPQKEESDDQEQMEWQGIADESDGSASSESEEPDVVEWSQMQASTMGKADKEGLRAFLSSSVKQQIAPPAASKGKSKASSQEDDKERELARLDVSLQELLSTIPQDAQGFSALPKKVNYTIQKNTPVTLRKALQHTRLKRAKAKAEEDRQSGAVLAKSKADGAPALTKQAARVEGGQEASRRRKAAGIGGVVGRLSQSGQLKVSRQEIAQVQSMRKQVLPKRRKL